MRKFPWITDGAFEYLQDFLNKKPCDVLEYGVGGSTIWLSNHPNVKSLLSFEHDKDWVLKVKDHLNLKNTDVWLLDRPYGKHTPNRKFDVILIDGRDRVDCARYCIDKIASGGILIVDNTERPEYQPIFDLYQHLNFISFTQHGPDQTGWQASHHWITTVFYDTN